MNSLIILASILNAIIIGLVIIGYFYKRPRTILLLGLSASGKTRFWRQKTGKDQVSTCISLKTNIQKTKDEIWIDVPGHEKLWESELSKLKLSGQVLIYYLIDAAVFARNRKQVAQRLYQTCNITALAKLKTPVTIKIMNQNHQMALELEKIKVLLDKELYRFIT